MTFSATVAHTARRSLRPMLTLLLVTALALPVVQAAQRLRVNVDGEVRHVLTFGDTVADVLETEGVLLAAGDEVVPAPETPVSEVGSITVLRTIEVEVDIDGVVTTHTGTWRSVGALLEEEGIEVAGDQLVEPDPRTSLEDGDRIRIESPIAVTVIADGEIRQLRTHLPSIGRLLDVYGIELGEQDRMSPTLGNVLTDGMEIVIQRVGTEEATEKVAIPFTEETRTTSELFTDQSRVVQHGVPGTRIDTYRVTLIDGEPATRELISEEVVEEPVTRIVEVGTTKRPPRRMADDGSVWYDLAQCESGGQWDYNGPSGFDGGLQFHPDTWTRNKLSGYPQYAWQASPAQQIEVGKRVQARQGWGAWPHCAQKLGLY